MGIPQSPTPLILRFRTAAILCALYVIIGAVISGADASHGLGKLGGGQCTGGIFYRRFVSRADRLYDDLMGLADFDHPGSRRWHHRLVPV